MGSAFFYHLTEATLEATLPMLIGKARGAGWRIIVRGSNAAQLEALDIALWLGEQTGFLPHGRAGGPHDAEQPVLLCLADEGAGQTAQCLMAVDSAAVAASDLETFERVCILFDGHDPVALDHARGQWKTLTAAGVAAQYWAQEDGRWTKKAESS